MVVSTDKVLACVYSICFLHSAIHSSIEASFSFDSATTSWLCMVRAGGARFSQLVELLPTAAGQQNSLQRLLRCCSQDSLAAHVGCFCKKGASLLLILQGEKLSLCSLKPNQRTKQRLVSQFCSMMTRGFFFLLGVPTWFG